MSDAQMLQALNDINQTLTDIAAGSLSGSNGPSAGQRAARGRGISSEEKAHQQRMEKAANQNAETLKEFNSIYRKQQKSFADYAIAASVTSSAFQQALDSSPLEDLDTKLVETFQKAIGKSNNGLVAQMADQVTDLAGVIEKERLVQQQMSFLEIQKAQARNLLTTEQYNQRMADAGIDATRQIQLMSRDFDELEEETMDLARAFNDASRSTVRSNRTLVDAAQAVASRWGFLATGGALLVKELYDAGSAAAKFGTAMNSIDAIGLGMSSAELSELQGQHKQTIMATNQTYGEFNTLLGQNNFHMRAYAGSLEAVAQMNAQSLTVHRNLNGSVQDQSTYIDEQQSLFKTWNRAFSMTAEQFTELNSQLLNSNEMQASMFKMDKTKRAQAFTDIQQTYQQLKANGMLHEEALGAIDALNKMSGTMDPKDRLKQAGRLQAYAGTLGMGAEGAEAAAIQRKGARASEGEKVRYAEIVSEINKRSAEQMQGGLGQELAHSTMIQKAGLDQIIGPMSAFRSVVTREGMKIDTTGPGGLATIAAEMEGMSDAAGLAMATADAALAFTKGPMYAAVLSIGGGIWAMVGQNAMNQTVGGLTQNMGRVAGIAGKVIGGLGGAAAVGTIAYGATSLLMEQFGLNEKLSNLLGFSDAPDAIEGSVINEDALILRELQKIAKTNEQSAYYGQSTQQLLDAAQKINLRTKDEIKDAAAATEAIEKEKIRVMKKSRGSARYSASGMY